MAMSFGTKSGRLTCKTFVDGEHEVSFCNVDAVFRTSKAPAEATLSLGCALHGETMLPVVRKLDAETLSYSE